MRTRASLYLSLLLAFLFTGGQVALPTMPKEENTVYMRGPLQSWRKLELPGKAISLKTDKQSRCIPIYWEVGITKEMAETQFQCAVAELVDMQDRDTLNRRRIIFKERWETVVPVVTPEGAKLAGILLLPTVHKTKSCKLKISLCHPDEYTINWSLQVIPAPRSFRLSSHEQTKLMPTLFVDILSVNAQIIELISTSWPHKWRIIWRGKIKQRRTSQGSAMCEAQLMIRNRFGRRITESAVLKKQSARPGHQIQLEGALQLESDPAYVPLQYKFILTYQDAIRDHEYEIYYYGAVRDLKDRRY